MRDVSLWTESDFANTTNVPRGTLSDFATWNTLLQKWNSRINLVAPREVGQFWHRHAYDSWQLNAYLPDNWTRLVDFGSGGGFPGLSLGIYAKQRGAGEVHLVESVGKKTSFLKTVTRDLSLPITVHSARIEALPPLKADVLTARAFAPLPKLFAYAAPHITEDATLLLPKGETADKEVETAREHWQFDLERYKSKTDPDATILRVTNLKAK
ncbi:16S rRNA (guanine(527)-N(7))-methyltransferase RsmG [Litorimonas sp. WD9-15]|uniref:16S rRNA (guanine(527)-N(7))-methyltransferase RsmG n=1 Tax=Litorimonas sp. WD9-15 TaxID=3418716 RepID=UPI003D0748D8